LIASILLAPEPSLPVSLTVSVSAFTFVSKSSDLMISLPSAKLLFSGNTFLLKVFKKEITN